ncbi:hypothetical protein A3I46_02425 [Candidatus Kaiserbacteria bacterium RIFCSPLOWO2_02_FULL_54_13]|uniref:Type 4 fimbrial biogenesis protein PilX N-terminal domain-containing protein n=1 Tax=Candidatus Kaiserbacteria bacterium RIFCSPHIGHO2_02_FULL_54_22 TaxID=1798495 RepID=A0A1F6DMN8_9BACT|nr:MAG: hypothetical protein A3C19_01245 [Candidatus Kaiserbacteria bacterium RIFCSPHIGHO2_02_FULL_54_22]OGG68178.1 MAG: hypothetical protein A3E99_03270 [Candidatus Kaiserbacteria bacterium RIFCSPHIGHO2_12_FULL_54_16]OGG82648.1 MAG: hypothetical protein A3I46_02425 [Candidatus Kaiserbacteria bacterium RIFCSPLOWO2_02_FULL_54_13]
MAIKKIQSGFALLIAVIFMSVMLTFGLALGSLGYKQQVLASSSIEAQYAFYAADSALECVLYADQQLGTFLVPPAQPSSAPSIVCGDDSLRPPISDDWSTLLWTITYRLPLDSNKRCADITIYKAAPDSGEITSIFSQGYDVSCDVVDTSEGARFVSRGINVYY